MNKSWPHFIPIVSGKKQWILEADESWLNSEKTIIPFRKKEEQARKYGIQECKHRIQLIMEEVASTIFTDPNLSQSYWNPVWYPPVPEYDIPTPSNNTQRSVVRILPQADFCESWLQVDNKPPTLEEFEQRLMQTLQYIRPEKFFIQFDTVRAIAWITAREFYSLPEVITAVKWYVSFCCAGKWNEILGIYCLQNRWAIEQLSEFLAETPVSNEDDKNDALLALARIHQKIT